MTANVPLLRQTMDHILAFPDLHKQLHWASVTDCGTAYCFAGWACVLSGLAADQKELEAYMFTCRLSDGESIEEKAQELLGIDDYTASELFFGRNSTADLKHYVDEIAEHGAIQTCDSEGL